MSQKIRSVRIVALRSKRIDALFDSGADANYLSVKLAQEIGAPQIRKVDTRLGDGTPRDGIYTEFIIMIKGGTFPTFGIIVENLDRQLIIGFPFMQQTKSILDFKQERIVFSERIIRDSKKTFRL